MLGDEVTGLDIEQLVSELRMTSVFVGLAILEAGWQLLAGTWL